MKNKPYVKKFDDYGKLLNPIIGKYESKTFLGTKKIVNDFNEINYEPVYLPNRSERRNKKKNVKVIKLRTAYLNKLKNLNKYLKPLEDYLIDNFPFFIKLRNEVKSTLQNFRLSLVR